MQAHSFFFSDLFTIEATASAIDMFDIHWTIK